MRQSVLERRVSQFCFLGWTTQWLEIIFGNSELRVNRETVWKHLWVRVVDLFLCVCVCVCLMCHSNTLPPTADLSAAPLPIQPTTQTLTLSRLLTGGLTLQDAVNNPTHEVNEPGGDQGVWHDVCGYNLITNTLIPLWACFLVFLWRRTVRWTTISRDVRRLRSVLLCSVLCV